MLERTGAIIAGVIFVSYIFVLSVYKPLAKWRKLRCKSSCNMKRHCSMLNVLEDRDCLTMSHPLQHLTIDGENLVT